MLELLNQLDGFDARSDTKVIAECLISFQTIRMNYEIIRILVHCSISGDHGNQ